MRKIIQISTTSPAVSVSKTLLGHMTMRAAPHVFALCDDGSAWIGGLDTSKENKGQWFTGWEKLPDVPQD